MLSVIVIASWISLILISGFLSKKYWPSQQELSRKIVHIGIGPIIPLAWWLEVPSNQAIPIASLVTIALLINHRYRFMPAVEDIQRESYGTVAYGLSITILLILFWSNNKAAVSAGVLAMAFGDGLAGLIGRQVQSPSWRVWGQKKSLIGTIIMAFTVLLILTTTVYLVGAPIYPMRILLVTLLTVGLEQVSRWGIDNLSVPLGVALTWPWITSA